MVGVPYGPVVLMRRCADCRTVKQDREFYPNPKRSDGLYTVCKPCVSDRRILRLYGISAAQYAEMLRAQEGCCKLCRTPQIDEPQRFTVDHDHACCPGAKTCGKCVRGLLCTRCNKALGLFRDDPELLTAAVHYVESKGVTS